MQSNKLEKNISQYLQVLNETIENNLSKQYCEGRP